MVKDLAVAKRHGGKVFDVICRYKNGGREASAIR
jgi:hypothetical protein